jgi:hypothetical protein
VPATSSKKAPVAAEAVAVEKPKPAPRKRTAARKPAAPAAPVRTRPLLAIALVAVLALGAAAAVSVSVLRADETQPAPAETVSAGDLAAFAGASATPVYWAGRIAGRELELSRTADGTFVRYLPPTVEAGGERRVLTVATYPVAAAYATAQAQAKGEGMTSRETRNGGLAVWSRAKPTSVYVAFDGVPQLVEVYAPIAAEARRVALSGRIRPVR